MKRRMLAPVALVATLSVGCGDKVIFPPLEASSTDAMSNAKVHAFASDVAGNATADAQGEEPSASNADVAIEEPRDSGSE
jgi:hypothetical protein